MPKGVTTKNDVLKMVLWGTDPAWRANANGYLSLHVADPSAGTQTTSPATYTGNNRAAITRDSDGWDIVTDTAQNKNQVQFTACAGGTNTITHVAYGELSGVGNGQIYYCGALTDDLAVSNLIQPQFATQALTIQEG